MTEPLLAQQLESRVEPRSQIRLTEPATINGIPLASITSLTGRYGGDHRFNHCRDVYVLAV